MNYDEYMVVITEEKLAKFFAKAFKDVVLPALEDMETRLASKEDLEVVKNDLNIRIDGVENNLTNLSTKIDNVEERLTKRINTVGSQVANVEEDAPTVEDFEKLEKRVKKVEVKLASI